MLLHVSLAARALGFRVEVCLRSFCCSLPGGAQSGVEGWIVGSLKSHYRALTEAPVNSRSTV